jgi:hypothetical protein
LRTFQNPYAFDPWNAGRHVEKYLLNFHITMEMARAKIMATDVAKPFTKLPAILTTRATKG